MSAIAARRQAQSAYKVRTNLRRLPVMLAHASELIYDSLKLFVCKQVREGQPTVDDNDSGCLQQSGKGR